MHDDRRLIEDRLGRVLGRIVPAVHPESVPLQVSIWAAPGEPVPVAEGWPRREPRPHRAPAGERRGAPAG